MSYVVPPEALPKYDPNELDQHFAVSGVYFLWDINGSLLYAGLSESVGGRIDQHLTAGRIPIWAFSYLRVYGQQRRKLYLSSIESAYILALEPAFNSQYRGGDEGTEDMTRAVQKEWREVIEQRHPPLVWTAKAVR